MFSKPLPVLEGLVGWIKTKMCLGLFTKRRKASFLWQLNLSGEVTAESFTV